MNKNIKNRNYKPLIWALTIGINGLIVFAIFFPDKEQFKQYDFSFLTLMNAVLNGATFILLLLARWAIRQKSIRLHRNFIILAFICTSFFLLSYLLYHFTTPSTPYGGGGILRYIYFFILITHVMLAIIIVPLALISMGRGLNMEVSLHKKITRWSMPIWLYVSSTGVIVYLMIAPYYK
jgi:putative membrane protein